MAKINKKRKIKSADNLLPSKIKSKSADKVSDFAENIINTVREPLLVLDKNLRVVKASRSFYDFFKVTSVETIGTLIYDLGNRQWNIPKLRELLETILPGKATFDNYEVEHDFSTIGKRIMLLNARQIKRAFGKEKIILLAIEDITERRGVEESLSEKSRITEEYLNILLDHAHAPIIIWDSSLAIKSFNQEFEKLSGYLWTEMQDKKIDMLFPEDKIDSTIELIKNNIGDEKSEVIEINILTKDKDIKTVLWNSANILDKEGENIVATIAQDITEHKLNEEALRQERDFSRTIIQSSPTFFVAIGSDGKTIMMNDLMLQNLGYTLSEVVGKDYLTNFVPVEDRERLSKIFEVLVTTNKPTVNENPILTKDGRKIIVEWHGKNILKPNGELNYFFGIGIDITERKRAEEKIRDIVKFPSENPNPILRIAHDGKLLYVNEAGMKQLPDWKLQTEQSAPNILQDVVFNTMNIGKVQVVELEYNEKVYSFYVAPFVEDGYTNLYGREITERKQAEKELQWKTAFLEAQVNSSIDGILVIDSYGKKILQNQRCIDLWKIPQNIVEQNDDAVQVQYVMNRTKYPEQFVEKVTHLYSHPDEISYDEIEFKDGMFLDRYSAPVLGQDGTNYGRIWTFRDITERKQAEEALHESEEKYKTITQSTVDVIFTLDKSGKLLFCNESVERVLGYKVEEVIGKSFAKFVLKKNLIELFLQIKNVFQHKEISNFVTQIYHKDGHLVDIEINGKLIKQKGKFVAQGSIRDITERKQAEERIHEKDIQFRKLSSQMPGLIFQFTRRPDGTYFVPIASEGIKNIFGCSPEDVLEDFTPIGRAIFPDDLARVISDIEYSAKHLSLFTCEFRVQIPGKSIQWIYSKSTPEKLADGSITWYGFNTDITERKLSEVALYEREQLFRGLFNASPMAITLMDPHNRTILWPIIDCNEATCLMNGFTREELIGHTIDVLNAREGSREESDDYFKKLKKEGIIHVDVVHRHKDGHLFPIEASTTVVTLGGHEMVLGIDHDITERKRAEAELQASNDAKRIFAERLAILSETTTELSKADSLDELCRRAVELCRERLHFDRPSILFVTEDFTAIQGTFGVDVDGRITDERGERYPAGPDYDFWPVIQGQVPLLRLTDAPLALKGQNVGQGTHIIAGLFDGNTVIGYISIDNLISKRPFDDSDCEIIHLYASAVGHLCSLKRTEETLRNERSLFRTLIDNIPDSIYSKDTQGRKTVANLEEVRNLGVKSEAEVIGKDDFAFYPKDLAEGFKVDDQLVLNTGTPVINKEEFVFDNSGKKRWKLTSKLPLKDTNNKIIGLVGVGRDITERKRAEEEIIMLAHSLKAVNECVSITDLENKIIFVNESFLKTYGYSENELVGKHIDIVRSLKNLPELVKEILTATKRGEWQGELLNKRKDGSEFPIYLSTTIIKDKNNKPIGFIGVATDITERKKILEELITAKERAEQSDRLKSEFLAQMSHEIRTPLNAIVGNVEYISEFFGEKMDPDIRNCFDDVDLSSKRIIRTIELIINVAQLQTSSYKPQFTKVDLNSEIFNKLCQEHQLSAKRKGLEIIYTCKEKDTKVISDEYCITQIFANLIDNAIKYTKKGKVEILLEKNKAGNIIVEVKDTGIGISKEFLPRIFEPFTQEEQGLSRNFEGNGLGLSLVKRYCELNNLIIEVESEKNVGSTFTVIFNK